MITGAVKSYYWMGFISRVGSNRPVMSQQNLKVRGGGAEGTRVRGGEVDMICTTTTILNIHISVIE